MTFPVGHVPFIKGKTRESHPELFKNVHGRPRTSDTVVRCSGPGCQKEVKTKTWNKSRSFCSYECRSSFMSLQLKQRHASGAMIGSYMRGSLTKKQQYASGQTVNWTQGKTKDTDPRIAASAKKIAKSVGNLVGLKNSFFGHKHSEATKAVLRAKFLARIKQHKYNKVITKPEQKVLDVITKYDLGFRYTGNGSFWVKGKLNPDFVAITNPKLVIEVEGCYWHNCPTCLPGKGYKKNIAHDLKRDAIYAKENIHVIKIWEHEVNDENNIIQKLGGV